MAWDEKHEIKLREQKRDVILAGGKEQQEKQHAKGKLTARERVELLFDDGQFEEIEMYIQSRIEFDGVKKRHFASDGVIAAYGKINGVNVYAVSQDSTISGGAGGEMHVNKICRTLELAIQNRCPIVYLCDSGGARIEEGIVSLSAYSRLFYLNTQASGLIVQIAAIMGNCAGGSSYSPAMCDFVFMVKNTSQFFITGPRVIMALTGEKVTMEELGGVEVHSRYSGQVHFACENDKCCLLDIRSLLSYITCPQVTYKNIGKINYRMEGELIKDIVPEYKKKAYDVRCVIKKICDNKDFLEVLPEFAANLVTGFCRLEGKTIGIVANQPMVKGGALDCDASDKCARFVRTCDCYGIPILVLEDVPGFYPGIAEEKKGILRHGCKMLYAFAEATVPKVTVIMRKAYGGAYCAMNSKALGADMVFAWPICEVAVMGADGAVDILFHREIKDAENAEEFRKKEIEKYEERYLTPYFAAAYGMIDEIIMPEETREKLIRVYNTLENKHVEKSKKKHGNIAL